MMFPILDVGFSEASTFEVAFSEAIGGLAWIYSRTASKRGGRMAEVDRA
jgi:hypothetical protein